MTIHIAAADAVYRPNAIEENQPLLESEEGWETCWEIIKDYYQFEHWAAAQCCLYCLYNEADDVTEYDRVAAFTTLKSLAKPDVQQPHFVTCTKGQCSSFHILDTEQQIISELSSVLIQPDDIDGRFPLAEYFHQAQGKTVRNDQALSHLHRLTIFGDSLSDSTGKMFSKSFGLVPSADQNYQGRFTNGFVWGEFITSPSFLAKPMVNYAEGGSPSASYNWWEGWKDGWLSLFINIFSSFDKQISYHASQPGDLAIIWLGSNDYMTFHKHDVNKVVDDQIKKIETLLNQGVKDILVFGVPDLSLTPYARHLRDAGHAEQLRLRSIAKVHNQYLADRVADLQQVHLDEEAIIEFFDITEAFTRVFVQAEIERYEVNEGINKHGYVHLFGKHYGINIDGNFLFNDDVHPTQEVHWILALMTEDIIRSRFSRNVEAVPAA